MLAKPESFKRERKVYDYISTPFRKGDKDSLIKAINEYNENVIPEHRISSVSGFIRESIIKNMRQTGIEVNISLEL